MSCFAKASSHLLALALLVAGSYATPVRSAGWQVVATDDITRNYHDVVFLDENRGFIVGELSGQGLYLYTVNGGHTLADWQGTTYSAPLRRIFFLPSDPNYGWIVGDGTIVLHTSDGGQSWNAFDTTGITDNSLRGVFFEDADTGWIATDTGFSGNIFKKPDAASNWIAETVNLGPNFSDLAFPNPTAGWAVASGACSMGCFYSSPGDSFWDPVAVSTRNFFSLRVVGPSELWAAGDWNSGQSTALLVWDGAGWNPQTHPQADLRDVDFAGSDSSNGWAVGLNGVILRRQAGSWGSELSPVTKDLAAVAVIDSEHAFAVGTDGTIVFRGCTVASECADGNECTDDVCSAGVCSNPPLVGNPCTDDGNGCTDDTCDGAGTCQHTPNSAPCDDGLFCNGTDTCSAGGCSLHSGDPCAGGPECADTCDEAADTCFLPPGTACTDDGNGCTDDTCDGAGTCQHTPNSAPCDDGLFCNGTDTCSGGGCSLHSGDPCAGGPECADSCDEAADSCFALPGTACTDDGNGCTDDTCDGSGTCQHTPNTAPCDDGDPCTQTDTCQGGTCRGSNPVVCDDGNVCTDDSCNPADGQCVFSDNTAPCDDGDACTENDTCAAGVCAGVPRNCDDGNGCTDDSCNPADGSCINTPNTAPCDDGLFCNGTDTCSGGGCSLHSGDPCAGGPECADTCDEAADSCFAPPGTACTDDGNGCTDDTCDGAGTCQHTPNTAPCDDGLWCTVDDVCQDGSCQGTERDCSFLSGPCYFYSCDEQADACRQGQSKPAGTECPPCGLCDGQGRCRPSGARQGDDCDDGDVCTASGQCDAQGTCVIEGWCEELVAAPGCQVAAEYDPGSPDCRLPPDKVELSARVGSNQDLGAGLFPVRVYLENTEYDSHNETAWTKGLHRVSLRMRLLADRHGRQPAYLAGSALLNGSAAGIEENWEADSGSLFLSFDDSLRGLLPPGDSEETAPWIVDMYLLGGFDQGQLVLEALAPCRAQADEVGCHDASGWQTISAPLSVASRPGSYLVSGEATPTGGCGCGTGQGTGWPGILFLALLLAGRRRVRT